MGIHRRRSRGWWGVFLCAFLALGVYIAFDVLDLDGSQLRDPLQGNAIAAESTQAETDRLLRYAPLTPETPGPIHLSPDFRFASESPQVSPGTTAVAFAPWLAAVRPRANLRQETSSASSPTDDSA